MGGLLFANDEDAEAEFLKNIQEIGGFQFQAPSQESLEGKSKKSLKSKGKESSK